MRILEPLCHFYLHANPYETFSSYGKEKLSKTFVEKRSDLVNGYTPELPTYPYVYPYTNEWIWVQDLSDVGIYSWSGPLWTA